MKGLMNEIGVVLLCRNSSSRLPGKALIQIEGKAILQYIIERIEQVLDRKSIVIATSTSGIDDTIQKFADDNKIFCYRGSLKDVSLRFYSAADHRKWKYAIRINGDNIFLDIPLLRKMIQISKLNKYDFISNVKNRTYPKGMSIEILNIPYYRTLLNDIQKKSEYEEHVTKYLYEHDTSDNYFYVYNKTLPQAGGIQLALDTPDDLIVIQKIICSFTRPHWEYNLYEIFSIYKDLGF